MSLAIASASADASLGDLAGAPRRQQDQIQKPDLADCAEIGFLWVALEEEMLRNRYLCRTTTLFMLPL